MKPSEHDFGFGSAAKPPKRGQYETDHKDLMNDPSLDPSRLSSSPAAHAGLIKDILVQIKSAPSLTGMVDYVKGVQSLSAAYSEAKEAVFSDTDKILIRGGLFIKVTEALDEYIASDLGAAVEKAERSIKEALKVVKFLEVQEPFGHNLNRVIIDRLEDVRTFNPTTQYAADEIFMLMKAAKAADITITDELRKETAFRITDKLFKEAKNPILVLGGLSDTAKHVNAAMGALNVPYNSAALAEIRDALVVSTERMIDTLNPVQYVYGINKMRDTFDVLGLEFTDEIKDRFYPKIVATGLQDIYNASSFEGMYSRANMADKLLEGLEAIGAKPASIAVENIRIAGAIARADIQDYSKKAQADLRAPEKAYHPGSPGFGHS